MEDLAFKIFEKSFNDYAQIIGRSRSKILISAAFNDKEIEFVHSKRGSDLDVGEWITSSFTIIQVIASIVQIIDFYQKSKKIDASKNDVVKELQNKSEEIKIEIDSIHRQEYEKIIEELLNK